MQWLKKLALTSTSCKFLLNHSFAAGYHHQHANPNRLLWFALEVFFFILDFLAFGHKKGLTDERKPFPQL